MERDYVYRFLKGQKQQLSRASGAEETPLILLEAEGYAAGRKVTQFIETIGKALYDRGLGEPYTKQVRQIMSNPETDDMERVALLMEQTRYWLECVGLSDAQRQELIDGLDSPSSSL